MNETNAAVLDVEVPEMPVNRIKDLFAQPALSTIEMALYEYAITGLTPILFDRMTEEQIDGLITGAKVDYGKDESMETKAFRKLYSDKYVKDMPAGALGIPNENFCAALRDTGKKVKFGQGTWDFVTSGTNGTLLYCMVRLIEPFIVLRKLDGEPITKDDMIIDRRKGNATQGTGAVGIVRPRMNEWGFAGHLQLSVSGDYALPERQLEKLINMAGLRAGLCSGRPGKQMPFGQFVLRHLKWIGGATPKKNNAPIDTPKPKPRGRRKAGAADPATPPADSDPAAGNGELTGDGLNNGDGHAKGDSHREEE